MRMVPGGKHPVSEDIDGALLFPARLEECIEEFAGKLTKGSTAWDLAQKAARHLTTFLAKWGEPLPYYAVLLADGDHMGKAIDSLKELPDHKRLSKELHSFATIARKIVDEHGGALVYSGGDDVLAFVPLHTVLDCATQLADKFAALMAPFAVPGQAAPTLSTGIVLAHAITPLDQTLAATRSAEKAAKAIPRKNALCVTVEKRGGEPIQIKGPRRATTELLTTLIALHERGAIATKAQYELMALERLMQQAGDGADVQRLVKSQAARVIARRRDRGGNPVSEETLAVINECLGNSPAELGRALYVAQLIARSKNQLGAQEP
jgi:CRISPR-associated protein Cmr2